MHVLERYLVDHDQCSSKSNFCNYKIFQETSTLIGDLSIITWANTRTPKAHLLTLHLNFFCLLCSSSFSSDLVGRENLTQPWYGQRCRHAARQREREICLVLDTLEILYRILHTMLHFSSNAPFLLFYIRSWERKENIIVTPFSSPSTIFMLGKYSKLPRNLTMCSGSDSTQLHQQTISQG